MFWNYRLSHYLHGAWKKALFSNNESFTLGRSNIVSTIRNDSCFRLTFSRPIRKLKKLLVAIFPLPDRIKRDESYQSDPKTYLDQVIGHWLYKIPILIDESVAQSEKDLTLEVAKKVTQVRGFLFFNFLFFTHADLIFRALVILI